MIINNLRVYRFPPSCEPTVDASSANQALYREEKRNPSRDSLHSVSVMSQLTKSQPADKL